MKDCLLLLLLSLGLRALWLGHAPLWSDEIFSVYWSQRDLGFLLGPGNHLETNPPAYYLLLHGWMRRFGSSALSVRALSVLCSAATVPVTYAIGRHLAGRSAALAAGVFLAIDPFAIYFAQDARAYALLALLEALALLGLCRALARMTQESRRLPWIMLFSASSIAAFLTHYTAFFFICAAFAAVGLHLLRAQGRSRGEVLLWTGAAMVVAGLVAAPLAVAASLAYSANLGWIDALRPHAVRTFFREVLTYPEIRSQRLADAACGVLLLVVASGLLRRRLDARQAVVMILVPAAYCTVLIGVSLVRPMLLVRVGAWLSVPVCLLLGHAVAAQRGTASRSVAAAAVLLIFGGLLAHGLLLRQPEDWNRAARVAADDRRCQGPLLTFGPYDMDVEYYRPGLANRPIYWVRTAQDKPDTAMSVLNGMVSRAVPLQPNRLAGFMGSHPGAVLLMPLVFRDGAVAALGDGAGQMRVRETLRGGITVICR